MWTALTCTTCSIVLIFHWTLALKPLHVHVNFLSFFLYRMKLLRNFSIMTECWQMYHAGKILRYMLCYDLHLWFVCGYISATSVQYLSGYCHCFRLMSSPPTWGKNELIYRGFMWKMFGYFSGDGTMRKNPDVWRKWTAGAAYNLHG